MSPEQIKEQIAAIRSHTRRVLKQPKEWRDRYIKYLTGESETCPEWIDETPTPESQWPTEGKIQDAFYEWYNKSNHGTGTTFEKVWKACAQWLRTSGVREETREGELRECLEEIANLNPYPKDIFQPISNGELKAVEGMLKNINGMSLDRLSGHIGRLLLKGIQTKAKKLLSKTI